MKPGVIAAASLTATTLLSVLACERDVVGPDTVVAVSLEGLPFPAVVAGDQLRDTTGAVVPVRARAFNYLGEELPGAPFRYLVLDRGASVDTVTGVVTGDSIRETPVRVVAVLERLQTQPQQLAIVPAPDSLQLTAGVDTLEYSVTDTTQNTSAALSVRVLTGATPAAPVRSWIVSYGIVQSAAPGLATVVEGGRESRIDTTGNDGTASRQVRLHVQELVTQVDSIVLLASARYRGAHVRGSPARLVVHIRPRAP